jgi:hypothetical protein
VLCTTPLDRIQDNGQTPYVNHPLTLVQAPKVHVVPSRQTRWHLEP